MLSEIVRHWTPGVLAGIAIGSAVAAVAPPAAFKIAFVVIAAIIGGKLLVGRESWWLGEGLPRHPLARLFGLAVGLMGSLTGVSGDSLCTMVLALYGMPIHQAVATSAAIVVPIALSRQPAVRKARAGAEPGTRPARRAQLACVPAALKTLVRVSISVRTILSNSSGVLERARPPCAAMRF